MTSRDRYGGREYILLKKITPHYKFYQNLVGLTLASHFANAKPNGSIKVLEIGCGDGYTSRILLDSDPRVSLTAVDISRERLSLVMENFGAELSSGRLRIVLSDALTLMELMADRTYDAFASAATLHNFDKRYRANVISQTARLLKPGGLFINADKFAVDDPLEHAQHLQWSLDMLNQFDRLNISELKASGFPITRADLLQLKQTWHDHFLEDEKPDIIQHERAAIASLIQSGFVDIRVIFRAQVDAVLTAVRAKCPE